MSKLVKVSFEATQQQIDEWVFILEVASEILYNEATGEPNEEGQQAQDLYKKLLPFKSK